MSAEVMNLDQAQQLALVLDEFLRAKPEIIGKANVRMEISEVSYKRTADNSEGQGAILTIASTNQSVIIDLFKALKGERPELAEIATYDNQAKVTVGTIRVPRNPDPDTTLGDLIEDTVSSGEGTRTVPLHELTFVRPLATAIPAKAPQGSRLS